MPKERLRRLPISQPTVKWSVGASSRSRCSTSELGINAIGSGDGVGFSSGLLTRPCRKSSPVIGMMAIREMRGGRDATNRLSAEGTIAMLVTRKRFHSRRLFSFERILEADGVLNLALYLVSLAFRLQLGVTDRLADGLLDCTFDLLRRSDDPVLSP